MSYEKTTIITIFIILTVWIYFGSWFFAKDTKSEGCKTEREKELEEVEQDLKKDTTTKEETDVSIEDMNVFYKSEIGRIPE